MRFLDTLRLQDAINAKKLAPKESGKESIPAAIAVTESVGEESKCISRKESSGYS